MKNWRLYLISSVGVFLALGYLNTVAPRALTRAAWFIVWSIGGLAIVGAIVLLLMGLRKLIFIWRIDLATIKKANNEADAAGFTQMIVPKGSVLFTRDVDPHARVVNRNLVPYPFQNGAFEPEAATDINFQMWKVLNVINQLSFTMDGPPPDFNQQGQIIDPAGSIEDDHDWISRIASEAPHIHLCGPTGEGKSTLGNHILNIMESEVPNTKIIVINPKHIASRPTWRIDPVAKDLESSMTTLRQMASLMEKRVKDPAFDPLKAVSIVAVVDEWDWLYDTYQRDAVNLIKILTKVGRELAIRILLVGQSSVKEDTGLNPAAYGNMTRIALGNAARRLASTNQLPVLPEDRKMLNEQLGRLMKAGDRAALIVPVRGVPMVRTVPFLGKRIWTTNMLPSGASPIALPADEEHNEAHEFDQEVAEAWMSAGSLRGTWHILNPGQPERTLGSRDFVSIKESLIRSGAVDPDHVW